MADIILTPLFDQKKRQFRTEGGGSTRFEKDFIDATNASIYKMNRRANLATAITTVANTDDTVTGLDEAYKDVLADGITAQLLLFGHRAAKGFEGQVTSSASRFDEGITEMFFDLINDRQDADETDDVINIEGTQD